MSDAVVIVTPEAPPQIGGVADYVARLICEWPAIDIEILTSIPGQAARVLPTGGKVLVQYSAYGFDPAGYPQSLLSELLNWKQVGGGQLVVMFHEIWTVLPVWHPQFLRQRRHRAAIARLSAAADAVFTTTPSQADLLQRVAGRAVRVLPAGPTITPLASDVIASKPGTAVLFGLQRARLRALRSMIAALKPAARTGRLARLTTIGSGNTTAGDEQERTLLQSMQMRDGYDIHGEQPSDEISRMLAAAEFALSDQDALSILKSSTFMSYAAHRLNIISPAANPAAPEPLCYLTSPAELAHGITADVLETRRNRLQEWQQATSSWSAIARAFADALSLQQK
jgi:hypothetical protein